MEHSRDEATEAMLRDIIAQGSDEVASFLNETDGQEGLGEEEGYVHDGSGDTMEVQEGDDRADCSGDRTESGQVYKLVKPVLTS